MENVSTEAMSRQAQQIWSMLDDMSENDPAAYRKFIERQMKEAKEQISPPEPHMCIQVTLLGSSVRPENKGRLPRAVTTQDKSAMPLFINFCSWKHVPEPKSSQDPVPVVGTSISHERDETGVFSLTNVAFNPKVLDEYGRFAKNHLDADTLIQLALDYVEHEQKVKVTRTYTVLPAETPNKGDISLIRLSFSNLQKNTKDQKSEQQINDLENTFGHLTSQEKDSLLYKLSTITSDNSSDSQDYQSSKSQNGDPKIIISGSKNSTTKKCLIEEVSNKIVTPKYSMETCGSEEEKQLILKVHLPGVKSVSDCQLDVSEDDVVLEVPGYYELKVKLPTNIDDNQAKAKFNKKISVLTLTMSVKNSKI